MKNREILTKGFGTLLPALVTYVSDELRIQHGEEWWAEGVLDTLYENQKENLPLDGTHEELINSMDIVLCLNLIDFRWSDIFRKKLSPDHRNWVKELIRTRNKWAHFGIEDINDGDTERALDTMARLCEQIDPVVTEEIRKLYRTVRYGSENGSASLLENTSTVERGEILIDNTPGLPSWRDIIKPHPDVAQGRYRNAEFAADLSQVARGEAAVEYQDPVEFFARTYITDGMSRLLIESLKRVGGAGGEPVLQLKTAFGGGKTHTMLALYHLLRGRAPLDEIPVIKPIIEQAGIEFEPVHVAVVVGTALDPSKFKRPGDMPGITINTVWGEIAAQLAKSVGNLELYDYVKAADNKHVSPGSESLINLFNACGPCMILIDEIVAYAKKLHGRNDLVAGTFDNFITFIQELTEAARASKNCLLVASMPESEIEIGGDAGKEALNAIEHTFGRIEAIWKPVAANEGFEVVRRRLFLPCENEASRDMVCDRFSKLYLDNPNDFPIETKEIDYRNRMIECYPIHPEIFDRLYKDWATLDRFQKTRGVLRLMASVIHDLWMNNDANPMIMPGFIPLNNPDIKNELTRYLDDTWNSIVDAQIDGRNSDPFSFDKHEPRFGKVMACRRVSRTIFLGSAPTVKEQSTRGIDRGHIRLGVIQPGDNIPLFDDALSKLNNESAYLYSSSIDDRFWYDTRPTLMKTAQDRALQMNESDVEHEIKQRLSKIRSKGLLTGVHAYPDNSMDVPDIPGVRLVILRTASAFKEIRSGNDAIISAENILNTRGTNPRDYKNMLVFIAPDADSIDSLKTAVRFYLAWESIDRDRENLNLDVTQTKDTKSNLTNANNAVELRIRETYSWLLVPYIDRSADIGTILWERIRIGGGTESIVDKIINQLEQSRLVLTEWAPGPLLHELDSLFWKETDYISIQELWKSLCMYCYLPKLSSYSVLEDTITKGLNAKEFFAIASGKSQNRYIELNMDNFGIPIDEYKILVKLDTALQQIKSERAVEESETVNRLRESDETTIEPTPNKTGSPSDTITEQETGPKNFHLSKDLDYVRVNREVGDIIEEIVAPLEQIAGSEVRISISIEISIPEGTPPDKVRTVKENCRTLKIDDSGFF